MLGGWGGGQKVRCISISVSQSVLIGLLGVPQDLRGQYYF